MPTRLRHRVLAILTSDLYPAIHGLRIGESLSQAVRDGLHVGLAYRVGTSDWYVVADGTLTLLVHAHDGRIIRLGVSAPAIEHLRADRLSQLLAALYLHPSDDHHVTG